MLSLVLPLSVLIRYSASLVKYFDTQYDETLGEEAKVVRQSKGDQHVHLCIYLVDPNSIVSIQSRRPKQSRITRARSQTHSSVAHGDEDSDAGYSEDGDEDENEAHLLMNPAELKVIKRLASRVNVLPVVARADELTESRLRAIKRTIKRELRAPGLGFGVFAPVSSPSAASQNGLETQVSIPTDTEPEEEDDRSSRPVIRIRSTKKSGERSRSRRHSRALDESPARGIDSDDEKTPVREVHAHLDGNEHAHYAPRITKAAIDSLLPFALVSPQSTRHRRNSSGKDDVLVSPGEPEIPGTPTSRCTSAPPSAFPAHYTHADNGPPREFPKGRFVRKYKWGTLDVCDPAHCDFVVMRTAIITTYFKVRTTVASLF
jgi:hypothetical protein